MVGYLASNPNYAGLGTNAGMALSLIYAGVFVWRISLSYSNPAKRYLAVSPGTSL